MSHPVINVVNESEEYKNLKEEMQELKTEFRNIRSENRKFRWQLRDLISELHEAWDSIEKLEREQNHSNQYNRQENIELTGIPDKDVIPHDKLEEECIKLLNKIGVTELKPEEIVACHRLPKKNDEDSPNVIIRFVNRKRAIECFKMKKI